MHAQAAGGPTLLLLPLGLSPSPNGVAAKPSRMSSACAFKARARPPGGWPGGATKPQQRTLDAKSVTSSASSSWLRSNNCATWPGAPNRNRSSACACACAMQGVSRYPQPETTVCMHCAVRSAGDEGQPGGVALHPLCTFALGSSLYTTRCFLLVFAMAAGCNRLLRADPHPPWTCVECESVFQQFLE